jgi:hypothetical protein
MQQTWLYGDPEWKANQHHPFQIWNTVYHQHRNMETTEEGWKSLLTKESLGNYFARWPSPR